MKTNINMERKLTKEERKKLIEKEKNAPREITKADLEILKEHFNSGR